MYEEFSVVYDAVMSDIPYDMWFERLRRELERRGKAGGHLCELGCGTGEMTARFCGAGYEVTGIDLSPDMLARAMEKKEEDQQILYLNQDMRDFSLHKPADVVLCICDSMNYLLREEDLLAAFGSVYENLDDDGIFVFDMKTEYCYRYILGDVVRFEDGDDYSVIWENTYDRMEKINEYFVTMFLFREDSGLYERYNECHRQRAYSREEVEHLLSRAGLTLYGCYGEDLEQEPGEQEERMYYVAGKDSAGRISARMEVG